MNQFNSVFFDASDYGVEGSNRLVDLHAGVGLPGELVLVLRWPLPPRHLFFLSPSLPRFAAAAAAVAFIDPFRFTLIGPLTTPESFPFGPKFTSINLEKDGGPNYSLRAATPEA